MLKQAIQGAMTVHRHRFDVQVAVRPALGMIP
jgi:hypothetical protein